MNHLVYHRISSESLEGRKQFALLIDPDKYDERSLASCITLAQNTGVNYIFVGGSLLTQNMINGAIKTIKDNSAIPVVLFPGSTLQFTPEADAILFLSLISGRNADLLIGRHVEVAPFVKQSGIEVIPTGYMLVDGGSQTTASYISNTFPIPANKPDIAASTAIAGELLGLKSIYLDAGSGAKESIPAEIINAVKQNVSLPVIAGGGMRTKEQIRSACNAGADVVVVGNIIEEKPELLSYFSEAIHG